MTTEFTDHRFIIGIDLGTTNSAVSYVDLQENERPAEAIKIFKIPQLTGPGEVNRLPVLPSFLYIPGEYDISKEAVIRLWDTADSHFAGSFARDHGTHVPTRLVSSAKSWLCHSNVDRHARILPWGARGEVSKVSPVDASAAFLEHIRMTWNKARGSDEGLHMENQWVTLTVPASFDEVARELTLEAARKAGLPNVVLLEEPLAAFYAWLTGHEKDWKDYIKPGELILVCDVGGGTTDFTLIVLKETEGSPRFERIAVGDHLILGGDNIDLALARKLEMRVTGPRRSLSTDHWKALCHQCRQAKESILSGSADSFRITLMGGGSRLLADTLSEQLREEDVRETVLEGFFPIVDIKDSPGIAGQKGITEFGLPYEQEPAVTRHLGWFLNRHRKDVEQILHRSSPAPDWILFNGGSLKPALIRERIREALQHWFGLDQDTPRALENPDPDLAVAIGAAYYGLVKTGQGVRVGSGSPRSYYLGISRSDQEPRGAEALCMVERGLEEGSAISIGEKSFEVLTNQPVRFVLYSSSYRSGDRHGDVVGIDESFTALPPLQTVIQYGKKGLQRTIPVAVEAEFTEVGTLSLWCRSRTSEHRWKLQFQLRDTPGPQEFVSEEQVLEAAVTESAQRRLKEVFSGPDKQDIERLARELSDIVELPRDEWPLGLIRTLADDLLDLESARKKGPEFEGAWMNLIGFCLRPGIGEGFDGQRMRRMWRLYLGGPVHANHRRVRIEWWIMWRRTAAGLTAGQQGQFMRNMTSVLFGKKADARKMSPQERLEMWMAAANMEKIHADDKIKLGDQLLSETPPPKMRPQHLWALSRLGARELLYGSADRVIPPRHASKWIEKLMAHDWPEPAPAGRAISQMARMTGDRSRDPDPETQKRVLDWMKKHELPGDVRRPVQEIVSLARRDQADIFGESLPSGLILRE